MTDEATIENIIQKYNRTVTGIHEECDSGDLIQPTPKLSSAKNVEFLTAIIVILRDVVECEQDIGPVYYAYYICKDRFCLLQCIKSEKVGVSG
ncbi:Hypothetical predicted protein [Octopus vulgaris]|uniref:Uncharacterized protein n=1 Tax=Octopus vulgaris TaxID=6645 RepID=A0AA36AXL8_OCTVU|nr:Hypothetical predicted protein [Octopus vulgaris]